MALAVNLPTYETIILVFNLTFSGMKMIEGNAHVYYILQLVR